MELLKRVGIFAIAIKGDVYIDIDKIKKHGMTLVYLKDESYKIDGFYIADASCDNSYQNIHFEKALLIPKASLNAKK